MDIDMLSHSPTLCNKFLQELNLNGMCLYNNTDQAYLFKHSNKIVNCSYILVFLKQSTCYTITPDTHQWYRINTDEITNTHKIALFNDLKVHTVPLPPAEPLEGNAFETSVRLTFSEAQKEHVSNTHTQPIYSSATSTNNNINSSLQNNNVHPHDQFTVILQKFSKIAQELRNFTKCLVTWPISHSHALQLKKILAN